MRIVVWWWLRSCVRWLPAWLARFGGTRGGCAALGAVLALLCAWWAVGEEGPLSTAALAQAPSEVAAIASERHDVYLGFAQSPAPLELRARRPQPALRRRERGPLRQTVRLQGAAIEPAPASVGEPRSRDLPVAAAPMIAAIASSAWASPTTISSFTLGRKSTTYSAPR